MDPVKVQGVTDWPQPVKVKDVQSFIGFVNFYQRFICSFSEIAHPLHVLTHKWKDWSWGVAKQQAFDALKSAEALDVGELRSNEWMCAEGVVLYQGRVYILDNPQLHHDLAHAHHGAAVAGYPGQWKMLELVSQNSWWPGLSRY